MGLQEKGSKINTDSKEKNADFLLNADLQTAVKNSSILFIGTVFNAIFGLICTILIARFYTVGEYGIYSLNVFLVVFIYGFAAIGVHEANSRYIAFYRGKNDITKVWGTIKTSFVIVIVSSTFFTIVLFLLSDFIATTVFDIPELKSVFQIFVISIPFWNIISLITNIFRGFESVKQKVYFTFFSIQILKVLFFVFAIVNNLDLTTVFWGFLSAIIITTIIAVLYFYKQLYAKVNLKEKTPWFFKDILSFSWPLIFTELAWFLISGLDKIMLGVLTSEIQIGYYNAASPIARYLIFFYTIIVFVFQPIASRLYAQNRMDELKKNYQVLTKWLITIAFPFIMVLLLFPSTIISLFYGEKYIIASTALQFMTIGILFFLTLCLSRELLTIMGKTKIIFYFTILGTAVNFVLNLAFIPLFGIDGAAFATMLTFFFISGIIGFYLFRKTGIHPFKRNLILPLSLSLVLLIVFYWFIGFFSLHNLGIVYKILIGIILFLSYFFMIIKTKSYDIEDISLFYHVEKKLGFRLSLIRKIIKRLL